MSSRIARVIALTFVLCSLIAWNRAAATGAQNCCSLISNCAAMTDSQLLSAAFLSSPGAPTHLGMCYYHDKSTCPSCFDDYYVKISTMPPPGGFDGGTGGLPLGSTLTDVARTLRQLCDTGACCCPQTAPTSSCPALGTPVWAQDPVTHSCCQYSNACLAPSGWARFSSQEECAGGKTAGVP